MKTIFVSSFHGLTSRVLEGEFIDTFPNDDVRVVLFCPAFKKEYFIKLFQRPHVIVEPVDFKPGFRSLTLLKLSWLFLPTRTMEIKWRCDMTNRWAYAAHRFIRVFRFLLPVFRSLLRALERLGREKVLDQYFKKYKPDLVFATDIQHSFDVALMRSAQHFKVKTLGLVRSWDNPTAKGLLRIVPENILVHNEIIKKELMFFNAVSRDRIHVIGVPHYDVYTNTKRMDRKKFFKMMDIDSSKRLVLFAPTGDRYCDTDGEVIEMFNAALRNEFFSQDVHVLVRMPPGDAVTFLDGFTPHKHMSFFYPGIQFKGEKIKQSEMNREDLEVLANQLYFADVVVSGLSTILIDTVVFDTPAVLYSIDGYQAERPYCKSLRRYHDYNHVRNVTRTNAFPLVTEEDALFQNIRRYLRDPQKEHAERFRLRKEQCGALDGHATRRLIDALRLALLES